MQSQNEKIEILIVGATGRLGSLITKHTLTNPKLNVNILIRNPQKNPDLVASVEKAGGKVLTGDLGEPESLKDKTKGMHTVISASSQMDEKIALHGQIALIDECVRSGVERFVPSDFAENLYAFPREELAQYTAIEYNLKVLDYAKKSPMKTLHFWPGLFVDSFFELHRTDYGYWGNKEHRYDLTTYEDTARYVSAAVSQKDRTGDLFFSANDYNIDEITEIYNRVRGTSITPKQYGTLEDLRKKYEEEKKKSGESFPTVLLSIYLLIYDDRCKFDKTNNHEFPEIKPLTVEEYLVQNPHVKLPSSA